MIKINTERGIKVKAKTKRTLKVIVITLAIVAASIVAGIAIWVAGITREPLDISLFALDRARTATKIYVMQEGEWTEWEEERILGERQFEFAPLSDIPEDLKNAFIAIEDKRFLTHKGVDWYRTAGAAANYLLNFDTRFGASTITQQLIKNVTGSSEISIERKIREISFALELEKEMSKDEILELYLNIINLSDNCYGVQSAARRYFSKSVSELTLIECAAIAAITNSPSYYNPITHPENNAERREVILSEMLGQGLISQKEYEENAKKELILAPDDSVVKSPVHSWYVDMVINDVIGDLQAKNGMTREDASDLVYGGGLEIYIQIDRDIQRTMEKYYENEANFVSGEGAQSAMIIIDPQNGDILGVVGAIGEKGGNRIQNYAVDTLRSPGSTIKPLSVYAPALEGGIITYASVYDDVPFSFNETGSGTYSPWPKNANGVYHGLSTMSYAIANSTNTVPLQILRQLGLSHSFYFLRDRLHLDEMIEQGQDASGRFVTDMDYAALALGQLNYGLSVRDITAAYSIFADNGSYHAPRSYSLVKDSRGNVILENNATEEQVISDANAEIMTKLLSEVVWGGTANSLTVKNRVALAAKTGTTQDNKDRWCIGYTPSLICGVWYGYEYPKEIPRSEKDHFLNAFDTVLTRIYENDVRSAYRDRRFESSASLIEAEYCMDSGLLPTDACLADPRGSRIKTGYFEKGSEPKTACDLHVLVEYDYICGGVATVFTPEDHIAKVGMLNIERSFPMQIIVSDAQYVYRTLPRALMPSLEPTESFFSVLETKKSYFGISATKSPYNRLCVSHFTYSDLIFERNLLRNQN